VCTGSCDSAYTHACARVCMRVVRQHLLATLPHTSTHTQMPTAAATEPLSLPDADDTASSKSASASATSSVGGRVSATGEPFSAVTSIGPSASQVKGASVSQLSALELGVPTSTGTSLERWSVGAGGQERGDIGVKISINMGSVGVGGGIEAGGGVDVVHRAKEMGAIAKGGRGVPLSGLQSDSFNFGIIGSFAVAQFLSVRSQLPSLAICPRFPLPLPVLPVCSLAYTDASLCTRTYVCCTYA